MYMTQRYQFARADGTPDWTVGNIDFDVMYDNARDLLRFHRGSGFTITEVPGNPGPTRRLIEIHDRLKVRIATQPADTLFRVKSVYDGFDLLFRRHEVSVDKGELVLAHSLSRLGTPYVFGATDCSWLTMVSYGEEGIDLPHNAHLQHLDRQVNSIKRTQILRGDLLFHHNDDHVSEYMGVLPDKGECVIDTEPHDTQAPWGGMQGTGVRVRSMQPGYYCDWANVSGIGRIIPINGRPT